ncbi:MAG: hypothetical protein R2813_01720 [Flavobacteriales bacterium]
MKNYTVLAFALAGSVSFGYNFSPAKIFLWVIVVPLTIGLVLSVLAIKLIEYPVDQVPNDLLKFQNLCCDGCIGVSIDRYS